ncbi:MAG: hypothetical protein KAU17_12460 [Spirochaetales bacterium]|nr:hypothetical protein [Spirochaetales bacterium]
MVKNFSSEHIYAIYCTDSSSDTWGADLLGNELLVSGDKKEFAVEPGIKDIRVDTQATHGESKGAYQNFNVLFEPITQSNCLYTILNCSLFLYKG